MVVIGLDLSLNCTGVCVYTEATQRRRAQTFYYNIISDHSLTKKNTELYHSIEYGTLHKEIGGTYSPQIYNHVSAPKSASHNEKENATSDNIHQILYRLKSIIRKHKPDAVAIESPTARAMGHTADLAGLNHCIREYLIESGIEFYMVAPTHLKKVFAGNGAAPKELMIDCWKQSDSNVSCLEILPKVDDLADAYALTQTFLGIFKNNS